MRLFFMGTAAAEGYPGIFCNCENCQEARLLGGRNLRFRSALLVNDDLLIDFGPDLSASAQRFNLNLSQVKTALITHAHEDHFMLENFDMRRKSFTAHLEIPTLQVFGPTEVREKLLAFSDDFDAMRVAAHTVHAFDTWQHGGYTFTAYHANHAVGRLEALFYGIEDGTHAALYASDTGAFPEDTWAALAGKSFDVIIMEETMGFGSYSQHMSFETFLETAAKIREQGMLRPGGRLIAQHFSHSYNPTHEKIEEVLCPHGVEVAYDGLEVKL